MERRSRLAACPPLECCDCNLPCSPPASVHARKLTPGDSKDPHDLYPSGIHGGMRLQGMPPVSLTRSSARRVAPDDERTAEEAAVGAGEEASQRRRRGARGEKGASAADAAGDGAGEEASQRRRRGGRGEKGASAADAAGDCAAAKNGLAAVSSVDTSGDDGGEARSQGGGGLGGGGNAAGAGASAPAGSNATHDVGEVGGDGPEETWDLCLVVDPKTDDLEAAKTEVEFLFNLFRKAGLTLTDPHPVNAKAGLSGEVFALCTASQDELEEEAEIMGLNKPLKLPASAQEKFAKLTNTNVLMY